MTQFTGDDIRHYEDVWNDFCAWNISQHDSQNTIDRWRAASKKWLNWCGDQRVNPRTADKSDVEEFLKQHNHLSSNSLKTAYMGVMSLYNWWMMGHGDLSISENPCADVDISDYTTRGSKYVRVLYREGKENLIAPSRGTVEALYPYAAEDGSDTALRNETLIRLMWDSAARCDEVQRMRVEKIDWDDRYISIRSSKLNPDQELYRRRVFFSDSTKRFLKLWLNGGREAISNKYADSEFVFMSEKGPQLSSGYISRIVKEAAFRHDEDPENDDDDIQYRMHTDAAERPRWLMTGHRLRHARITYLVDETDMQLSNIRMLAGHEKIETTMDYVSTDWDTVQADYHSAVDE